MGGVGEREMGDGQTNRKNSREEVAGVYVDVEKGETDGKGRRKSGVQKTDAIEWRGRGGVKKAKIAERRRTKWSLKERRGKRRQR